MHLNTRNIRIGFLTLAIVIAMAPVVLAQSILDARRLEFTPSADHATVDDGGIPFVESYSLAVYVSGATTPSQTVNLGKPTPDSDGMIRLDFVSLLATPLTAGVVYETRVSAVGPGGSSPSDPSNTFGFSVACAPTISPTSQSFAAAGGSGSIAVSAGSGCPWTAASNVSWLSVSGGAAGTGSGSVTFTVATQTASSQRTGTLTVAGKTFTVTQAAATACSFSISPTSQAFAAAGGSGSVAVTTTAGCAWTASDSVSWVTVVTGASGTGNGTVSFSVSANTSSSRSTTLSVAGKSFSITEAAPTAPCSYTVSPLSVTQGATGGSGTFTVTTQTGCTWTSSAGASWITVSGSGTGSGTASYTVGANTTSSSRTGSVMVAGKTATVTQGRAAAAAPPVAPGNLRIIGG
jgi:hypothetical protein